MVEIMLPFLKNFIIGAPLSGQVRKLIYLGLDWTRTKDPPISLAQASILANLFRHKIPVLPMAYSVNHEGFSAKKISEEIMEKSSANTDLAIGAFVWNEKATQEILTGLKSNGFKGRIIMGGPQISYVKKGIEAYYPQADIFIRGYAEEALAELMLSEQDRPEITGVHYAGTEDKGLSANADLEKLPSPYLTGIIPPQGFMRFETQRGCPFRCSFCQHRESDITQKRRNFDQDRIQEEIAWISKNNVIQDVAVLDPTFNSGPKYLEVMQGFIDGKFSGKLALQIRLEMIKPEFLDLVSELNKTGRVVLEAGIQTTNKAEQKIIQRPNNMPKVIKALEEIKKRNIEVETSLIFGLPGQTVESFTESIEFCKKMAVDRIYAFPLMLLRGTPLHAMKKMLNLTESSDINLEKINRLQTDIPHVISSYSFTFDDWKKMADLAEGLEKYNTRSKTSIMLREVSALKTYDRGVRS